MSWKPHVTVAAIAEQAGRLLLVEEWVDGQRRLNQPAGHLEEDESLLEAVARETLEETAWTFEPQFLVGIYRWKALDGKTFVRFTLSGEAVRHQPDVPLDTGIIGPVWLTPGEIRAREPELRSPLVIRSMEDYLSGPRFPLSILHDLGHA